ncbi:hypothetical protein [Pseudomonas congelans]|uniref:hypothetical protein n=1 Tax=Pseudomonas congelans TaxID=200452 RepID=UPI00117A136A|nr:hypothetical protein [Pseudomonas congelans]
MNYIQDIKTTLRTFATEDNDSSIVLKGAWGTGKTHLWQQVVSAEAGLFKKRNYSYVSLFGISTLKDLKRALFENKVLRERAASQPSADSFHENLKDLAGKSSSWLRKGSSLLNDITAFGFRGVGPAVEALQFFRVTDTLIVLDDFERKSSSLHDKEVLGLVSLLSESKNCRVLMLLNDQGLSAEYTSYHEKVFDYEINFEPSARDAASIALPESPEVFGILKENCIKLEITNLRLLTKIRRYAEIILKSIKNKDLKVINRAFLVLPLAIQSIYGGPNAKAEIEFILREQYRPLFDLDDPDPEMQKEREEHDKKLQFLHDYGLSTLDELDMSIIKLVQNGYLEQSKLEEVVKKFEEKIEHEKHMHKLRAAWDFYHKSFFDNEQAVIDGFNGAILEGLHHFTLSELDSITGLYYELNRADEINAIIEQYMSTIIHKFNFEDKEDVFHWPASSYLDEKLNEYFLAKSSVRNRNLQELINTAMESKSGMQVHGIIEGLSLVDEKEYSNYLATLESSQLTNIVRMLLKCGNVVTHDTDTQKAYKLTFLKTYRSLLELASRSQLNKTRMAKFLTYEKLYQRLELEFKQQESEKLSSSDTKPED